MLYAFRASHELSVSALELELQAEVDKFVSSWLLLEEQGLARESGANQLAKRIFDEYVLRPEVADDEVERYHTASRAARGYCTKLVKRYARDSGRNRLTTDVRRYYRQGLAEKLRAA